MKLVVLAEVYESHDLRAVGAERSIHGVSKQTQKLGTYIHTQRDRENASPYIFFEAGAAEANGCLQEVWSLELSNTLSLLSLSLSLSGITLNHTDSDAARDASMK
jgi:hypothetical protein